MIVCYEGGEPTFTIRPDPTKIREADGKIHQNNE